MPHTKEIEAARGYLDLGMLEDALAELSPESRSTLDGHRILIEIYIGQKDWAGADAEARAALRKFPKAGDFYIQGAYARRRKESVRAALEFLLEGSPWLVGEPIFHFNLACYEAQLGNLERAERSLSRAFEMDLSCVEMARREIDLRPIQDRIEALAENVRRLKSGVSGDLARWKKLLEFGNLDERKRALDVLIEHRAESIIAELLSHPEPIVVEFVMHGLWECWMREQGNEAYEQLQDGIRMMNNGEMDEAEKCFYRLVREYRGWPEAVNKLATVLALQGRYRDSIDLCIQVLAVKPHHFGCWSGLLMCAQKVEDWTAAHEAAKNLVRILPHNESYRKTLKLIETVRGIS